MRLITPLLLVCFAATALAAPEASKTGVPATTDDPPATAEDGTPVDGEEGESAENAALEADVLADLSEAADALLQQEEDRKAEIAAERKKAKDEEHETLTTIAGKTYNKVVINGVDDAGIRIRHEAGTARIKFPDAPVKLQERFGYDPEAASEALREEKAREAARIRASLAGLRAEAASKDPRTARTSRRPPTPRPSSRPPTSRRPPSAPRPTKTGPTLSSDDPAILALVAKIEAIEAGMKSVENVAARYETQAVKLEQEALSSARGDGTVNHVVMRQAQALREKANQQYVKLDPARKLIRNYRTQIKELKTGIKQK